LRAALRWEAPFPTTRSCAQSWQRPADCVYDISCAGCSVPRPMPNAARGTTLDHVSGSERFTPSHTQSQIEDCSLDRGLPDGSPRGCVGLQSQSQAGPSNLSGTAVPVPNQSLHPHRDSSPSPGRPLYRAIPHSALGVWNITTIRIIYPCEYSDMPCLSALRMAASHIMQSDGPTLKQVLS